MTESTVVVLGLTPTGELHECERCQARWDVPLGSEEDEVDNREHRLGLIAEHVCDPFVDPARVRAIRVRAEQLATEVGPCPIDMNSAADDGEMESEAYRSYSTRVRFAAETVAWEYDADLASFTVARVLGGWTSVTDQVIQSAYFIAMHAAKEPRERALQLARHAVFQPPFGLNPRSFRPSDVRLAMTLIEEVRSSQGCPERCREVSDIDALLWLEQFERDACGMF